MVYNQNKLLLGKDLKHLHADRIRTSHVEVSKILADGNFGKPVRVLTQSGLNMRGKNMNLSSNKTHDIFRRAFRTEVTDISCLRDSHVAQFLRICFEEHAVRVAVWSIEFGELSQFLRHHDSTDQQSVYQKPQTNDLLFICCQISSGMEYLEKQNIVHKNLAARNCIIGTGLKVKVSNFAKEMDTCSSNYGLIGLEVPVSLRWMSWEHVCTGYHSTKSDVWSFGMTMWEILLHCRQVPYPSMDDAAVLRYLRLQELGECSFVSSKLPKPVGISCEIYQLMCSMWRKNPKERPNFSKIRSTILLLGHLMGSLE